MKNLIVTGLCFLFLCNANAQEGEQSENAVEYFNKFQQFSDTTPDADSAFYFAKKLASNDKYAFLLRSLLHESFAQRFIHRVTSDSNDKKNRLLSEEILLKMVSDSNQLLVESVKPIYLWQRIQDNKNNLPVLDSLSNTFFKTQLLASDIYQYFGRFLRGKFLE